MLPLRSTIRRNTNSLVCVFCQQTRAASKKFWDVDKASGTRTAEFRRKHPRPTTPRASRTKTWLEGLRNTGGIFAACDAGFLKTSPEGIYSALVELGEELAAKRDPNAIEVFHKYNVNIDDLVPIARVLLREEATRTLGSLLLRQGSKAGVPAATIRLVRAAFLRKMPLNSPELMDPLTHLKRLANKEKNPSAMVLLAQIEYKRGEEISAVDLLTKALGMQTDGSETMDEKDFNPQTGLSKDVVAENLSINEAEGSYAWSFLGKIWLDHDDMEKARAAYKKGAEEFGDPESYWQLAKLEIGCTIERVEYTIKAAGRGHGDAAYWLGQYYRMTSDILAKENANCIAVFEVEGYGRNKQARIEAAKRSHAQAEKQRQLISKMPKVPFQPDIDPDDWKSNHCNYVDPTLSLAAEWYYIAQAMEAEDVDLILKDLHKKVGVEHRLTFHLLYSFLSPWAQLLSN